MAKLFLIISAICVLDESTFPTRAPRNARFDQKTTYLVAYRSDIHWRLYYRLSGLHCSIRPQRPTAPYFDGLRVASAKASSNFE